MQEPGGSCSTDEVPKRGLISVQKPKLTKAWPLTYTRQVCGRAEGSLIRLRGINLPLTSCVLMSKSYNVSEPLVQISKMGLGTPSLPLSEGYYEDYIRLIYMKVLYEIEPHKWNIDGNDSPCSQMLEDPQLSLW